MKKLRLLILSITLCCMSGCFTSTKDITTNAGGEMGILVDDDGSIGINTAQPENPNSAGSQAVTITKPDGTVVTIGQSTGGAFENTMGKLKEVFAQCKLYHIGAIACLIIGALILSLSPSYSNKGGWAIIGAGGVLFSLGAILPDFGVYITIGMFVIAVFGGLYIFHRKQIVKITR